MSAQESTPDGSAIPGLSFRGFAIRAIIGGVVIFAAMCLGAVCFFGSVNRALAALHGDEVIIEAVLLPDDNPSAPQRLSIVAASLSNNELTILGAESGCGCIEFVGLPAKIPPRGRCVIHTKEEPEHKRTAASNVVIYTTSRVNPQIVAQVPP